jgi:hypothetical protein
VNVNVVASTRDYSEETQNAGGDALYALLTNTLTVAVDSLAFSAELREVSADLGARGTLYVGHVNLTVSAYDVLHHETSDTDHDSQQGLSSGGLIGVVIGAVLFLLLCGGSVGYFFYIKNNKKKYAQVSPDINV